jgi:hypothetical protein
MSEQIDELEAAKAKLISLAGSFDPLEIVREHPLTSVAVAVAAGAAVGSDPKYVANLSRIVRFIVEIFQAFTDPPAAAPVTPTEKVSK